MSRKIEQYEIIRELGQGGMGTVYLGHDPRLDREVAIKVLKPQLYMEDPEFSARFEREAKIVASLSHSSIVPIYEYGDDGQWRYFVMPYMAGGSLHDRLKKGALSLREALPILRRISTGLEKAHSNGIVHRDLKPGNILFDGDGEAYLSDFGIVKLADPTGKGTVQMTRTGVTLGTPHYMSPEQLDGAGDLDSRSDIYALGIILYEMLSGKKPYDHESMPRIIAMHYSQPIPNILEVNPNLPPGLADVIRKAMAKMREERYGSVREMYEGIQQAVSRPVQSQTPARSKPESALTPEKPPQVPAERLPASRPATAKTDSKKQAVPRAEQPVNVPEASPQAGQAIQNQGIGALEQLPEHPPETPMVEEAGGRASWRSRHPRLIAGLFLLFSGLPIAIVSLFYYSDSFLLRGGIAFELERFLFADSSIPDLLFNFGIIPRPGFAFILISFPIAIIIGFLQWLFLRKYLRAAWLWVPIYSGLILFVSLIVFFIYSNFFLDFYLSSDIPVRASPLIFIWVLIGLSIGLLPPLIGFVWLLVFPKRATIEQ